MRVEMMLDMALNRTTAVCSALVMLAVTWTPVFAAESEKKQTLVGWRGN